MVEREDKHDRFRRLAETRVSKAMHAIRLVGNLSNRSNYEYTDRDVQQIVKALEGELETMKIRFKSSDFRGMSEFKLSGDK